MFSENLKTLRKQKGMSQEVLAQQLHVVRQTISKWEKGLSVPDAEMLVKIAEIFEISVSELLGEKIEETQDMNEIAIQLALLNEQLANKSRRNKRIIKTILITLAVVVLVCFIFTFAGITSYKYVDKTGELITVDLTCTLDDEEYYFSVTYDEQYNVIEAGGDQWIADHVYVEQYSDADILIAQIEDYFNDRGGEVIISE
ncbi:MAG: helix-turn-helix domain-containing protein [Erysipelotrichaceae bacterium]|nr:helix-turn-helix domain-containing protein [Erysipelotrichaceae bacterium]